MNEREIFEAALALADPTEQAAFLERACGDNMAQRDRLQELLDAQLRLGSFLESPAVAAVPTIDHAPLEKPGTQIGPYKLLQQIGEGGMGVVYMAEQHEPVRRRVALKIIKPGMDTRQVIARFEAERQALSLMDHPNIAKVLDAGTTDSGRPYFVMELVKGQPITQYCDEKHLTPRQRLELLLPVCQAIQHAHQKGIIHRDIKPTNILVAEYDQQPVPKVIDFGVAKATSQTLTEKTMFTGLGQIVGTLEYMSPEQAKVNQLDIDTRSDIYSLGVLLYELLTGSTPFDKTRLRSAAFDEMLRIIREEEPPKPSTRLSDSGEALASISAQRHTEPAKLSKLVRGELDWIVMKALEKDRNRRFETANAMAMDIQRYLADEQVQACPPSAAYRFRKFARRNKGGLAASALVLFFLLLLGSGVGWAVRDRSAREAEAARRQADRLAKVAGQVELNLAEMDRLEKEQKWPEALTVARRAEAAVTGGEADEETTARVRARVKDLAFIDHLERIRMEHIDTLEIDGELSQAFRDYGVDVDDRAVEFSVERLGARPVLALPLASALDEWAFARKTANSGKDNASWKRLVAIADGIDPEPLRSRLRSAPYPVPWETQDELRRLTESIDVRVHHPATLYRLTWATQGDHVLRMLRDAQLVYPRDYWINYHLANALRTSTGNTQQNLDGAIRFATVAAAVRPSAAQVGNSLLSNLLLERGDREEAIAILRKNIETDPKRSSVPYRDLGRALREQGKPDEAIAVFRQGLAAKPEQAGILWRDIGDTLRDQQRPTEAAEAYRQAVDAYFQNFKTGPHSNSALYTIREFLREQKKLDEAIVVFHQAIDARPLAAGECWREIGDILWGQKKLDEAIAAYRQALAARPERAYSRWCWYDIGSILLTQGKSDEAVAAYRQAIAASQKFSDTRPGFDHDDAVLRQRIGDSLRKRKMLDEAVAVYRQAIAVSQQFSEAGPNEASLYHKLGFALRDQNKPVEANAAFDRAIELYRKQLNWTPASRNSYIGVVFRDKGELDEAIAAFRKAFEYDPQHDPTTRDLVNALRARGLPNEAIAVYRKAIESNQQNVEIYFELGAILEQQGKREEALAVYRKAVERASTPKEIAKAYFNTGLALSRHKKVPEAIAAYYRVIELDQKPYTAGAYNNLGNLLRDWKKPAEAIDAFRRFIELDPENADGHNNLGTVLCDQLKEYDQAIECFHKALKLAPKHAHANANLFVALKKKGWNLINCPDLKRRDPQLAVDSLKAALDRAPKSAVGWQCLGWIQFKTGDWKSSIESLKSSCEFQEGGKGDSGQWIVLALAHAKLSTQEGLPEQEREDHRAEARRWFDQANKQIDKWWRLRPGDETGQAIWDFREEARELMKNEYKQK